MRRHAVIVTALVGVATVFAGSPAHAGAPAGTPVTACGTVVTGDAYLAHDLSCGDGSAVTVSGNARLDLRGHTISGQGPTSSSQGVFFVEVGDAEVRNGRITGFYNGVYGSGSGTKTVRGVTVDGSANGVAAHGDMFETNTAVVRVDRSRIESNTTGISLGWFHRAEITRTEVVNNNWGADVAWQGSAVVSRSTFQDNAVGLLCSDNTTCEVTASTFTGHQEEGLFQYESDVQVSGSTFSHNGAGWGGAFGHTRITGSTFTSNTVGVRSGWSHALELERSTLRDNATGYTGEAEDTTLDSISQSKLVHNGDGLVSESTAIALRSVSAIANSGWGIYAPHATDLGGNRGSGNGNDPQCVGVVCGPTS
ncbi:hypothetical protein ASD16_17260 [Cellulomonas sp. Root485]|uniref:NosD domain-containing protein n=1 Tax=Cellulomonas sp. Root485 TaxID=1736546 RepID=UPI0006FD3138|nr:NosD domain-containing protein [Cellulomonas sp. Root485]KQY22355.1 hypothetical protein ASD16_17260 [Cellulomonas sp. Root485]